MGDKRKEERRDESHQKTDHTSAICLISIFPGEG